MYITALVCFAGCGFLAWAVCKAAARGDEMAEVGKGQETPSTPCVTAPSKVHSQSPSGHASTVGPATLTTAEATVLLDAVRQGLAPCAGTDEMAALRAEMLMGLHLAKLAAKFGPREAVAMVAFCLPEGFRQEIAPAWWARMLEGDYRLLEVRG